LKFGKALNWIMADLAVVLRVSCKEDSSPKVELGPAPQTQPTDSTIYPEIPLPQMTESKILRYEGSLQDHIQKINWQDYPQAYELALKTIEKTKESFPQFSRLLDYALNKTEWYLTEKPLLSLLGQYDVPVRTQLVDGSEPSAHTVQRVFMNKKALESSFFPGRSLESHLFNNLILRMIFLAESDPACTINTICSNQPQESEDSSLSWQTLDLSGYQVDEFFTSFKYAIDNHKDQNPRDYILRLLLNMGIELRPLYSMALIQESQLQKILDEKVLLQQANCPLVLSSYRGPSKVGYRLSISPQDGYFLGSFDSSANPLKVIAKNGRIEVFFDEGKIILDPYTRASGSRYLVSEFKLKEILTSSGKSFCSAIGETP
ncbi:MAG: hypothetical protein ACK5RO_01445, partial [Pseudobdellovibrionaceae bacterium]